MTIRLDRDIVDWLKKNGSGYQTCINPAQAARLNTVQFIGADHRLSWSAAFASAGRRYKPIVWPTETPSSEQYCR
jgi:hypothetical protein